MNALPLAADSVYRITGGSWYWPALVVVVLTIMGIAWFLIAKPTTDTTLRKCLIAIAVILTIAAVVLVAVFILERVFGVYF